MKMDVSQLMTMARRKMNLCTAQFIYHAQRKNPVDQIIIQPWDKYMYVFWDQAPCNACKFLLFFVSLQVNFHLVIKSQLVQIFQGKVLSGITTLKSIFSYGNFFFF